MLSALPSVQLPTRPVPLIPDAVPPEAAPSRATSSLFEPTVQPLPMEPLEPPSSTPSVVDQLFEALQARESNRPEPAPEPPKPPMTRRGLRGLIEQEASAKRAPTPAVPVEGALSDFEVQGSARAFTPPPVESFNHRLTELAAPAVEPVTDLVTPPYEPALVDLESVFPDPPASPAARKTAKSKSARPRRGKPVGRERDVDRREGAIRRFGAPALAAFLVAAVGAAAAFVVVTKLQDDPDSLRSGVAASSVVSPAAVAPTSSPSAAPAVEVGPAKFGVFRGTSRSDVAAFERWAGRDVQVVVDFPQRSNWQQIADPGGLLQEWKGSGYRLVLSTAMLPVDQQASMAAGARGEYDRYYRTLAENLVAAGQQDTVVRLGWEFNLGSSAWSTGNPKVFIRYWRSIVEAMRSVPGQNFEFDWNVNVGDTTHDGTRYYPGADYVDYVGVDVYDVSWDDDTYPYPPDCPASCRLPRQQAVWDRLYGGVGGLNFWARFARAKGKPMSLPEWGLWERDDRHGGNDDPYFIKQMHKFITDRSNNVAYQAYFEISQGEAQHSMQQDFPAAGKVFRKLFKSP